MRSMLTTLAFPQRAEKHREIAARHAEKAVKHNRALGLSTEPAVAALRRRS